MSLTDRQMRILVEARGAKIVGKGDPDVEALIRAGYLATTRPSGTVFEPTERGLRAVAEWLGGAGSALANAPAPKSGAPLTSCDDCDEYCPEIDGAAYLIHSLLEDHPRARLRGYKGDLLRELMAMRDERLPQWDGMTGREKVDLTNRAYEINKALGADGRYSWKPSHRVAGANSGSVDHGLDNEMIETALASSDKLGTALRSAVHANLSKLGAVEIDSQVRRLRRKIKKRRLAQS